MRFPVWPLLLVTTSVSAQQPLDPVRGAPDTSAFRRLELPAPNTIRTGSGTPGPDYWQQRTDYLIRASLDTAARTVRGEERITYYNNSPDTLRYLWLQLDQNLFRTDSRGHRVMDQHGRYGPVGVEGGVRILKVSTPAVPSRSRAA